VPTIGTIGCLKIKKLCTKFSDDYQNDRNMHIIINEGEGNFDEGCASPAPPNEAPVSLNQDALESDNVNSRVLDSGLVVTFGPKRIGKPSQDPKCEELPNYAPKATTPPSKRTTDYGREARARFSFKSDTLANREVASDYIFREMVKDKIPSTSIVKRLPLAVEISMTPTSSELQAKKLRNTALVVRRKDELEAPVWRFYRKHNDVLPWFHITDRGEQR